jgi:5-hydroxyisourate hydrolase-like protein (transthyretin family)
MAVTLPLRIASVMQAGVPRERTIRRTVTRHGKRKTVRTRLTVLRPASGVAFGRRVQITGRLLNRDGQGIAGADVQVLSRSEVSPEQLVAVLHTDNSGSYTYTATGDTSRILRFACAGSSSILPAQAEVRLQVPAVSSLHVSRRHVLNGHAVTFSGRVRTLPVPAGGKLIELQVLLSDRWQTFRTARTDQAGRWALPYRFARTRGLQHYRFRAGLPHEAGYPFTDGRSRSVGVRVTGQ